MEKLVDQWHCWGDLSFDHKILCKMNLCSSFSYSTIEFCLQMFIAHDVKLKRLLNFHKIIQGWARNENKNMDIESIKKQSKISCPICMDEMKLENSTFYGHIFCQEFIYGVMHKIIFLFFKKKLI